MTGLRVDDILNSNMKNSTADVLRRLGDYLARREVVSNANLLNEVSGLPATPFDNASLVSVLGVDAANGRGGGQFRWVDGGVEASVEGLIYSRPDGYWERVITGHVSPMMAGAKGDGWTDDSAAIERAFRFAAKNNVPLDGEGRIYKVAVKPDVNDYNKFPKIIRGFNFFCDNEIGLLTLWAGGSSRKRSKMIIEECTFWGSGVTNKESANDSYRFLSTRFINLTVRNCKFVGCQTISCGLGYCDEVIFENNEIILSQRDAVNITNAQNVKVVGNTFISCADDAIAVHINDGYGTVVYRGNSNVHDRNIVIAHNKILGSQGIVSLGAVGAHVHDNYLKSIYGRAIVVGGVDTGSSEGSTPARNNHIHNNTVVDLIRARSITTSVLNTYFQVGGEGMRDGGGNIPGLPIPSTGFDATVRPYGALAKGYNSSGARLYASNGYKMHNNIFRMECGELQYLSDDGGFYPEMTPCFPAQPSTAYLAGDVVFSTNMRVYMALVDTTTPSSPDDAYLESVPLVWQEQDGLPEHSKWAATAAYAVGARVVARGNCYVARAAGTSSATFPGGFGTGITDGTVTWDWVSYGQDAPDLHEVSTAYAVGDSVYTVDSGVTRSWICFIAGTTGGSSPPITEDSLVTDGSVTWRSRGYAPLGVVRPEGYYNIGVSLSNDDLRGVGLLSGSLHNFDFSYNTMENATSCLALISGINNAFVFDNINVFHNTFKDWSGALLVDAGLTADCEGVINLGFNLCDGDPYNRSSGRNANGSWASDGDPTFVNTDDIYDVRGYANTIKNVRRIQNVGSGRYSPIVPDLYECDIRVDSGSTSNFGLRSLPSGVIYIPKISDATNANYGKRLSTYEHTYADLTSVAATTAPAPFLSDGLSFKISRTNTAAAGAVENYVTTAGVYCTVAHANTTAYTLNQLVVADTNKVYQCVAAGTSGSGTPPTGTGTGQTDGTVTWDYYAPLAVFKSVVLTS